MITKEDVIELLKTVEDPELHLDIWTLGLIYDIAIQDNKVTVTMTFTSPFCPFGRLLVDEVKEGLEKKGAEAEVTITFEPPWQPSEELKEMLGIPF